MRPVLVGDVHGCAAELDALLARLRERTGAHFTLLSTGDLVNRGPHSLRVLERVRELEARGRARAVLGNHELSLLATWLGLRPLRAGDSFSDVLEAPDAAEWMEWIRTWPVALEMPLGRHPLVLVHAAVSPAWSRAELRAQARRIEARLRGSWKSARELLAAAPAEDADAATLAMLTRCRSVDAEGRWSPDPPAHPQDAWHARWAQHRHDYGVAYGHWSQQGLHVAPGLRGLDSGCVHHGRGRQGWLTAWLPDPDAPDPFALPDDRFVRVPALRCYWPFGGSRRIGRTA